jgi:hypothetical protein
MSTEILLAWSGGKDCLMALQRLLADPQWRVAGLLTTVNRNYQRVAMHGVQRAPEQVARMGIVGAVAGRALAGGGAAEDQCKPRAQQVGQDVRLSWQVHRAGNR